MFITKILCLQYLNTWQVQLFVTVYLSPHIFNIVGQALNCTILNIILSIGLENIAVFSKPFFQRVDFLVELNSIIKKTWQCYKLDSEKILNLLLADVCKNFIQFGFYFIRCVFKIKSSMEVSQYEKQLSFINLALNLQINLENLFQMSINTCITD